MASEFHAIVLLSFLYVGIHLGQGFIQEMQLHESYNDDDGNYYTIRTELPDTSRMGGKFKRMCTRGFWEGYEGLVTGNRSWLFLGNVENPAEFTCVNVTQPYPSYRRVGAPNTDTDSVTLYIRPFISHPVLLVSRSPYAGIKEGQVVKVAFVGQSNWTLFEGTNFDGNRACFSNPNSTYSPFYFAMDDIAATYNLKTVGSLFKGCPLDMGEAVIQMQNQWKSSGSSF